MKKQELTPDYIKNHRLALGLSQREAARLLNVSKNTWIRWEQGKSRYDELALRLMRRLALQECPNPCLEATRHHISSDFLDQHVLTCEKCWLMIQYLAKKRPNKA
jgi:transcriptional regulator with XRE-family HTH domain